MANKGEEELECSFCFSHAVKRQEDGSYICQVCHAVQDLRKTYDEPDNIQTGSGFSYSIRISQRPTEDTLRLNYVVLSEAVQLILACQTVAAEEKVGMSISDSVYYFFMKFHHLVKPPVTDDTFSYLLLILLSGILKFGIPVTHIDIIRWIRDGIIPFANPESFLPESFVERLSPVELKCLRPNIVNMNRLIMKRGTVYPHRIHPLPNPKLVLWRIAAFLGLPEMSFVSFIVKLAATHPFPKSKLIKRVFETDNTQNLYSIAKFMKYGYAVPMSLAIVGLHLIYRLDGTNWVHPTFVSLGYPRFDDILRGSLIQREITPSFPVMRGQLPGLHTDFIRILETGASVPIEITSLMNEVREGHGTEASLVYDVDDLASLNQDVRALISGLSREFGIRQHLILQQFASLTRKRFGNLEAARKNEL